MDWRICLAVVFVWLLYLFGCCICLAVVFAWLDCLVQNIGPLVDGWRTIAQAIIYSDRISSLTQLTYLISWRVVTLTCFIVLSIN